MKIREKLKNNCCKNYKLVLMDFMMPKMNGIEASKKIQEMIGDNVITPLSIIMITAHDSDQMREKVKEISIIKEV